MTAAAVDTTLQLACLLVLSVPVAWLTQIRLPVLRALYAEPVLTQPVHKYLVMHVPLGRQIVIQCRLHRAKLAKVDTTLLLRLSPALNVPQDITMLTQIRPRLATRMQKAA